MSTKIYNAYKIDNLTMPQVMECLYKIKTNYLEDIKDFIINKVDHQKILEKYNYNSFKEMLMDVHLKNINSSFNWNASVMVYFHKDDIYLITFGLPEFFLDSFGENNISDYHYQNQCDPWYDYEENLTPEQLKEYELDWAQREKVWDEIIGNRYRFSESGLSYDIFSADDLSLFCYKLWNLIDVKNND